MKQPQILLIDDDYELTRGLRTSLENEGYKVVMTQNGVDGLQAAHRIHPDLIILDVNMPWLDGLEVCRRLRQDSDGILRHVPILFLTSRNEIEDRVAGLDEGADDYLNKPFHIKELKARVRALLRRQQTADSLPTDENEIQIGPLTLHLKACWVRHNNNQPVQLTLAEFDLLYYLMNHLDQPFSSQELLEEVWSYQPGMADPSLARWHIKNLRHKIEPDPASPVYLRTVPRMGYMLSFP
ncbi:MAG: response regulator transcription factor [Ardenticatenaceae bacterium]|nr:response regulator transcription factor [Ardenticatenaceae bacterium]